MISKPLGYSYNGIPIYIINKIYIQFMYEAIKLDADTNLMLYTNLKEKIYDVPIVSQNNVVLNSFDQLELSLSGVGIEVYFFVFVVATFNS